MKKSANCVALAALLTFATSTAHAEVGFNFINVFDVGNPDDPVPDAVDNTLFFGGVDHAYSIATTEVTNAQYVDFLNAIAATDTFGVFNANMDIDRSPTVGTGPFTYAVKPGFDSKPVTFVSFFDATRFVNWLENGQPTGTQGPGTTEDGTYTISGTTIDPRGDEATFVLPSEDEWYKAAYYDPRLASQGGPSGDNNYWLYPTQSDALDPPTPEAPAGGANSANFASAVFNSTGMQTANVGAYTGTTSFYGGFDFGGNVFEWTEGLDLTGPLPERVVRGGNWNSPSSAQLLAATSRTLVLPGGGSFEGGFGFRVAAFLNYVPEPGTAVLAVTGILLLMMFSGRRFQHRTR